jgi:integrase
MPDIHTECKDFWRSVVWMKDLSKPFMAPTNIESFILKYDNYLRNNVPLSEGSIRDYKRSIRRFLIHNEASIEKVNAFLTLSAHEKRSYYVKAAFKHLFDFIGQPQLINSIRKIRYKPRASVGFRLPGEEILKIIHLIDNPLHKIIAMIQYETGCRAFEVISIKKDKIFFDKDGANIVIIGKGEKEGYLRISKSTSSEIEKLISGKKNPYPFLNSRSSDVFAAIRTNYQYYRKSLKDAAAKAGYARFNSHDFRRSFAEDVYNESKDALLVKAALRHSRFATTELYLMGRDAGVRDIQKKVRGV